MLRKPRKGIEKVWSEPGVHLTCNRGKRKCNGVSVGVLECGGEDGWEWGLPSVQPCMDSPQVPPRCLRLLGDRLENASANGELNRLN